MEVGELRADGTDPGKIVAEEAGVSAGLVEGDERHDRPGPMPSALPFRRSIISRAKRKPIALSVRG